MVSFQEFSILSCPFNRIVISTEIRVQYLKQKYLRLVEQYSTVLYYST